MKKLLSAIFVISSLFASAQFPQGINYQSIIRNTSGVVLPSTAVTVEFKLYSSPTSSISTVLLYDETHSATTNSFGMVNLVIGHGTPIGGLVAFNNIPWIIGIEYEVWVNSSQVGTRQPFMSVPYAFNALTADWAPAPTVTYTGNVLSVGGNTVSIPTGTNYVGGTGITVSSNTITNNAPDQTVSLTGLGSATVTGTYPNFSIETPTVSAAAPPSITGAGSATVTSAGNSFTVDVGAPAPPVIVGAGATTVTASGNTYTVTTPVSPVYTAGNGIDISPGGVISNTAAAVTPTITGMGVANVTSAGNSFTVDVPAAATPTITGLGSATVTSAGNSFTVEVPSAVTPTVTGTGIAVVTPTTGNSFNVDVAAPIMTYSPPTNVLTLNQGSAITTVTLNGTGASTVSITGAGMANVTPTTGSTFTVSVPNPTLSVGGGSISISNGNSVALPASTSLTAGSSNITLNQSGNNYTITPVTPNFVNSGPSTITGSYPNYTLTSVSSPSTTLVQGTNITLNQSGNTYTVNSVTPSLSVAGNNITITPGNMVALPSHTLSSTATSLTIANGNSVAWPTHSLSVNSNSLTINGPGGNTVVMPAPTLALSGSTLTSGASTNSVNLATIPGLWSASSTTAVVLTNTLNNVGLGVIPASQFKLDVAATAGNSVTIHAFNTGSGDAFAGVYGENNNSGIGVYGQSNSGKGIFGKSTSGTGTGVYGESDSGFGGKFLTTNTLTASNAAQVLTNGTGAALFVRSFNAARFAGDFVGNVNINGRLKVDSVLSMEAYATPPQTSNASQGRIYFDGPSNRFMVSENSGPYKPLFGNAPWMQSAGSVTLTNINDRVGIGTSTPNAALEVAVTNTVTDGIQVNVSNAANGSNAIQSTHSGMGKAGHFEITNGSNSSPVLYARGSAGSGVAFMSHALGTGGAGEFKVFGSSNTADAIFCQTGALGNAGFFETFNPSTNASAVAAFSAGRSATIKAINTNTTNAGAHGLLANAISGSAISASNSSSVAATMNVNQNGIGDAAQIIATQGRAIYASNNSSSGYSTAEFANGGGSNVIYAYKNSGSTGGNVAGFANNEPANGSDAVQVFNVGTGAGISSSNTNASPTAYAGVFDGGITTKGKTTNNTAYAFRAFNSASTSLLSVRNDAVVEIGANVGINILNPTNRLHVNSSYSNAAAFIENITSVSTASVAHGVFAKASSSHSLAAAVFANNIGAGPSVFGIKTASDDGIAGRFENLNTSNTADAVFAANNGGGAAIHAVNGPTVTGGSNLALMIENGHIGSTASSVVTASTNATCGCIGSITMDSHSTDVVGTLRAVFSSTTGAIVDVTVSFTKPYKKYPVVMITPTESPNAGNSYPKYIVVPVGVSGNYTGFKLTIVGGGVNNPGSYGYNYMVIEGK